MADERDSSELGRLLGLIVHDLRNPTSTIGGNLAYLKEVGPAGADDAGEALADAELAVGELMRGFEQVAWIARWLAGDAVATVTDGDVASALRAVESKAGGMDLRVEVPDGPLPARGAGTLPRLLEVLLANSAQHARSGPARLSAHERDGEVVVELTDTGAAVALELRDAVFTLEGQSRIKGRADGRYSRAAGLFAARLLADAMGARLEADGEDGRAIFRIRLGARI